MGDLTGTLALFDVGQTLAAVTLTSSGDRIAHLAVYPDVPRLLTELRERGTRLGILSDRGSIPADDVDRALADAGLRGYFEPSLVIYRRKDSSRPFLDAAAIAGDARRRLYVGEDSRERAYALQAGYLVAPHPRLARVVLEEGASLRYVRVGAPPGRTDREWRDALREHGVLPVYAAGAGEVYAITTAAAAARLDDLGLWVDRLGAADEALASDLYLLRDDRQRATGFLVRDGNSEQFFATGQTAGSVLASTAEGLVVAVAAGHSVESLHFTGSRHGHNLKLRPAVGWLDPLDQRPGAAGLTEADHVKASVTAREKEILDARIRTEDIEGHVARYAGHRPAGADSDLVITSRHIQHPDNGLAVSTLVQDFERIGAGRLEVRRHRFLHEGAPLDNVEAELAGRGLEGVVLVTAHMDSTAARGFPYDPARDPAPGADDDASGMAGVLATAAAITALDEALGVPRRTVRFVLFNAEEHGLVGSLAYARDQGELDAPIVAVYQLDMTGYDVAPEPAFEVHTGFSPSARVQERSLVLARALTELVGQVSPGLPPPQIYPAHGERDPAEDRSDHTSFQMEGYAACLTSEDLFAGPGPGSPPQEMNPEYHLATDTKINLGYATDIARLVAAAAWVSATR